MNNRHLDYKSDNSNYQISENELYLTDYIAIVRIHLKKIIVIFLMALSLGIYSTYSKIPKYRAQCICNYHTTAWNKIIKRLI